MEVRDEQELIAKYRVIKNNFERVNVSISSCLWLFSNLYDIYKLQRYWFDYAVEFYTNIVVFILFIYSIYPKLIPYNVYNHFKIITAMNGRGFLLISISFLFITDSHSFHRFCAIILLISGILCFICEILIPTTKEEIMKITEIFENEVKNKNQDGIMVISSNTEYTNHFFEDLNGNNNIKGIKIGENMKDNNKINMGESDENKLKEIDEKMNDNDEKNKNNIQSSNPYDFPDDF